MDLYKHVSSSRLFQETTSASSASSASSSSTKKKNKVSLKAKRESMKAAENEKLEAPVTNGKEDSAV